MPKQNKAKQPSKNNSWLTTFKLMEVKYNAALHTLEHPNGELIAVLSHSVTAELAFKMADALSGQHKQPIRRISRNHRYCAYLTNEFNY